MVGDRFRPSKTLGFCPPPPTMEGDTKKNPPHHGGGIKSFFGFLIPPPPMERVSPNISRPHVWPMLLLDPPCRQGREATIPTELNFDNSKE